MSKINDIVSTKLFRSILIVGIVTITILGVTIMKYFSIRNDLAIANQNRAALADTLRVSKNKVGTLEYSKQILVAKHKSDVKDLNKNLSDVVKDYEGKIHELSVLNAEIKSDTIVITNTEFINYPNSIKSLKWSVNNKYDENNSRSIAGESKFKFDSINDKFRPLETVITKDVIRFNIIQGLRTAKDGKIEMFASSDYPGFSATELNSVIIDPTSHPVLKKFTKPKKFNLSVYGGYGATADLKNNALVIGPQVGGGLTYTIW